jgi:hypothetical protein
MFTIGGFCGLLTISVGIIVGLILLPKSDWWNKDAF